MFYKEVIHYDEHKNPELLSSFEDKFQVELPLKIPSPGYNSEVSVQETNYSSYSYTLDMIPFYRLIKIYRIEFGNFISEISV